MLLSMILTEPAGNYLSVAINQGSSVTTSGAFSAINRTSTSDNIELINWGSISSPGGTGFSASSTSGVLDPPLPGDVELGFALEAVLSGDVGAVTCGGGALNLAIKVSRTIAAACGGITGAAVDASWLAVIV